MANVFIYSNSFVAKTILYKIDYLFNIKIDQVILLKENHNGKETFDFIHNIKVILLEKLDDCVDISDIIVIIKDENIPQKSLNYILFKSEELKKTCIEIQNPWKKDFSHDIDNKDYEVYDFVKYPVILNLGVDVSSQQFCGEILLNKILTENNVKFKQVFSNTTKDILLQLCGKEIVNTTFFEQLNSISKSDEYDVIIYSINIGKNINDITKYRDIIKHINPDFTILQTDMKFEQYEIANNIIKYGCLSTLDIIIKSMYNSFKEFVFYCKKDITDDPFVKYIEDVNLDSKLAFMILSKIAFPENIIRF